MPDDWVPGSWGGSRREQNLRAASALIEERFGVPTRESEDTVREAASAGLSARAAACLLYANLGGSLTLARCHQAAALIPLPATVSRPLSGPTHGPGRGARWVPSVGGRTLMEGSP